MSDETVIKVCGWCRADLGDVDMAEVQHHFFIAHNEWGSQSVRYFYPERIEDEIQAWQRRLATHASSVDKDSDLSVLGDVQ